VIDEQLPSNGEYSSRLQALADVLRCSVCDGAYEMSPSRLRCNCCGRTFAVVDNIPVLLDDDTAGTALDRIDDYNAAMGIDESVIRQTARSGTGFSAPSATGLDTLLKSVRAQVCSHSYSSKTNRWAGSR
jgi:uncharacterized protein YbaR (Trm112 family)